MLTSISCSFYQKLLVMISDPKTEFPDVKSSDPKLVLPLQLFLPTPYWLAKDTFFLKVDLGPPEKFSIILTRENQKCHKIHHY